jgi:hypothetical protein
LNWRLPTYAWLLSRLPGERWIQAALVGLSTIALAIAFTAQARHCAVGAAAAGAFLLFGVVRWAIDGQAYLAQEPWAATLILISLGAHSRGGRWWALAVAAGIAALLFRELALPYCGLACTFALYRRRWAEAASWTAGIALFCCFFAWHIGRVHEQLAYDEMAASTGLSQWLRFGGLDFVLLTLRMNSLLFAAPGWLLWAYLLITLFSLARSTDDTSHLACLGALGYILCFAVVGRPENFYWGLMAAPLLAWGVAPLPAALRERMGASRQHNTDGKRLCQPA